MSSPHDQTPLTPRWHLSREDSDGAWLGQAGAGSTHPGPHLPAVRGCAVGHLRNSPQALHSSLHPQALCGEAPGRPEPYGLPQELEGPDL